MSDHDALLPALLRIWIWAASWTLSWHAPDQPVALLYAQSVSPYWMHRPLTIRT
ncbi:hypothetical protein CGRA01v4_07314 [Colletotrichum graminicola]|nr:hypothetical protein CGRA01v4_07314 [Colletotrichum graminicola]